MSRAMSRAMNGLRTFCVRGQVDEKVIEIQRGDDGPHRFVTVHTVALLARSYPRARRKRFPPGATVARAGAGLRPLVVGTLAYWSMCCQCTTQQSAFSLRSISSRYFISCPAGTLLRMTV